MNNTQRVLLAIYLPFTILVLIFDHLYPEADAVQYVKYAVMTTLFFSVLIMQKQCREQRILVLAFFFMVIADLLSVFSPTLHFINCNLKPLGSVGFLLAYLCLIIVYQKNFRIGQVEISAAVPIAALYIVGLLLLRPYVDKVILVGAMLFGVVLCYMTWSGINTIFWQYYGLKTARLMAISASLILISDLAVGIASFHPQYSGMFIPWLKNIVWAAYIPAWTLLAAVVSEEHPIK